jgi:hypothetical protein
MARLQGIEAKRRVLIEDGGMLTAEKAGEIPTMSRQAAEKRRKVGRLIGVSLGRRGFGYPPWHLPKKALWRILDTVLNVLQEHDAWTKLVFLMTQNAALNGVRPIDALRSGNFEEVLAAARS